MFFLSSVAPTAKSSERDLILDAIRKLQPALTKEDALRLANALRAVSNSDSCTVDWPTLLAIGFNESSLIKSKINNDSNDYGLMQINEKNVLTLGLNVSRLMKDEQYSLSVACKILSANKKNLSKKYYFWLGSYRAGTALWKESTRSNAIAYDQIIKRTIRKIGLKVPDRRVARL